MINLTKIIYNSLLITTCSITLYASPISQSAKEGQILFDEANCKKCHIQEGNFDKMNEKVQNIQNLKSWVSTCDNSLHIGWFPEEQENVAEYLNEAHYKYKKVK